MTTQPDCPGRESVSPTAPAPVNGTPERSAAPTEVMVEARPVQHRPAGRWAAMELAGVSQKVAALDLALVCIVALVIPFGLEFALALLSPGLMEGASLDLLIVRKGFDALLLIALTWYLLRRNGLPPEALGLQTHGLARQVLWAVPTLVAVYMAMLFAVVVILILVTLVPSLQEDVESRLEFVKLLPLGDTLRQVLLLVPVAVHEELLFRTLLIPFLRRLTGSWIAAVSLSAALFAPLHLAQGWLGILQIFGVGLMFGMFFVLSRSTLAVVLAHFVFNFLQMQLLYWVKDVIPDWSL